MTKTRSMDTRFTVPAEDVEKMVKSYIYKKFGLVTRRGEPYPYKNFGEFAHIAPARGFNDGLSSTKDYEIVFTRKYEDGKAGF